MWNSAKEQPMDWQPSGLQEQEQGLICSSDVFSISGLNHSWRSRQPHMLTHTRSQYLQEQTMDWQDSDPRSSSDQRDPKKRPQEQTDQQSVRHVAVIPRPVPRPSALNDPQQADGNQNSTNVQARQQEAYNVPQLNPDNLQSAVDNRDRDVILNNKKLDDIIANKAQSVLLKQFQSSIGGLQDMGLFQKSFLVAAGDSIQLHYTGKDHAVCSTNSDGRVRVYDSSPWKKLPHQ